MPILLKKIDGSIITTFGGDSDYVGEIIYIKSVVGEIGLEDYILLTAFEGLVQDFSSVINGQFCATTPTNFGPNGCPTFTNLNLSF
jgi:hypothetical protein